jgi:hypothetical protein
MVAPAKCLSQIYWNVALTNVFFFHLEKKEAWKQACF